MPADTSSVESIDLRNILRIPDDAMDQAMGIAYQLYLAGRMGEAETVCKGLIACDPRFWWPHSLYAAILRRLGRDDEALDAVERALTHEPRQPKLLLMRAELMLTIARRNASPAAGSNRRPSAVGAVARNF